MLLPLMLQRRQSLHSTTHLVPQGTIRPRYRTKKSTSHTRSWRSPGTTHQLGRKGNAKFKHPPHRIEFRLSCRVRSYQAIGSGSFSHQPSMCRDWPEPSRVDPPVEGWRTMPRCRATIFSSWCATLPSHLASMRWWASSRNRTSEDPGSDTATWRSNQTFKILISTVSWGTFDKQETLLNWRRCST